MMNWRTLLAFLAAMFLSQTVAAQMPGLTITGDPTARGGATWTYQAVTDGVTYRMSGALLKPAGSGPFPAVLLSHGKDGSATSNNARMWQGWGMVAISPTYTHASGVDAGLPTGGPGGASQANILRAHKALEILRSLAYVDPSRIAAHGHSMGSMVNAALAGTYPGELRVASHTAGGVDPAGLAPMATTEAQARGIVTPYQAHHGDADPVVPLSYDMRLSELIPGEHALYVYPGVDHRGIKFNATMYTLVRAWYEAHGMFD